MEEKHTSAYITQSLKSTCDDWGISAQVLAVVHDGAANIKDTGSGNCWLDVGCSTHKLHLVVTSAMGIDKTSNSTISRCVGAASRLVGHFHHSPTATTELLKRHRAMDSSQDLRKLVQHVKTRWNSVCDMFARLLELRWPVVACLSDRAVTKLSDAKTLDLKDEQWELMTELLPILQKLQMCTALFSAEKSPSAATVYPTLWKLITTTLTASNDDSSVTASFKEAVVVGLKQRFEMEADHVTEHPFIICTVLDPQLKQMTAFPAAVREKAYASVRSLVTEVDSTAPATCSASTSSSASADNREPPSKRQRTDIAEGIGLLHPFTTKTFSTVY